MIVEGSPFVWITRVGISYKRSVRRGEENACGKLVRGQFTAGFGGD